VDPTGKLAKRARKHAAPIDPDRLAEIRDGAKGKARRHLSEAAAKHLQAKLDRLRTAGAVKGVRRVRRVEAAGQS
jgi:hypothetical protein